MRRVDTLAAAAALGLLTARRVLLLAAALLPERPLPEDGATPSVALLVPAHDEAATVDRLLASLDRLDYPRDRLHVVLVDDGSGDGTWARMRRWVEARPGARALRLERRFGKSGALNAALAEAPPSELAVVCDADLSLAPDYLRRLAAAFADPGVGAASAFVTAANADAGLVSRYSALETWVHQLVTSAGKDRLGLNPPTFAGSAYRRSALEAVGGFPGAAAGDDVGASAALTRAGWRTRFVAAARADHLLAAHPADLWRQHVRWGRNVFEAARTDGGDPRAAPRRRRLELALAAVGYGDRVALLAALGLTAARRLPPAVPLGYLVLRALESAVAVARAGQARRLPAYLGAAALLFPLDAAASLAATVALRAKGPPAWRSPRRLPNSGPLEERLAGEAVRVPA